MMPGVAALPRASSRNSATVTGRIGPLLSCSAKPLTVLIVSS
jgi:hypothetical protein